jgi:hypothetical protein
MSDTLYLSLWYPNLRLETLPDKLTAVLSEFAAHGGEPRVYAATVWPVSWSESPVFQSVWGRGVYLSEGGIEPRLAVEEALELRHDDYAYEFQIGWSLWELESENAGPPFDKLRAGFRQAQGGPSTSLRSAQDDNLSLFAQDGNLSPIAQDYNPPPTAQDDGHFGRWVRQPRLVRVTGYGPLFDEGTYEADGHIRLDFGSDAPFLDEWEDDKELNAISARHVEQNVRQLVELTTAVEKNSGATARLLWSELGESLAQRLAARLGGAN